MNVVCLIMHALQFKFKGKPEDHHIVHDAPKPVPAKDEVLVKVKSSALDTVTEPIIEKEFPVAYILHKAKNPLYLGYHFSGTVEAVGSQEQVSDLKVGDDVFGFLQYNGSQTQGAFAEYITVKHNECATKPSGIDFDVAAASTTEPITALQALRDMGGLREGADTQQTILVVGAAGGVGSAAVQIAKNLFGAHVTAVCSTKDVKQVKSEFGAHIVIDRSVEPGYVQKLIEEKAKFDVILDTPCVLPSSATKLLKSQGTIVTTAPSGTMYWNQIKMIFSSKTATWIMCDSNQKDLNIIGKLLSGQDQLTVPIDSRFKVKDMAQAMAKHAGSHNGRVVIQVENGWE
mmetsp:Transcript_8119/g.10134  ORF Transcript_8119/g.10134 Transcript_8119/m.10134 type:complete len:344 (-) Transcript_8119:120-1151(-)